MWAFCPHRNNSHEAPKVVTKSTASHATNDDGEIALHQASPHIAAAMAVSRKASMVTLAGSESNRQRHTTARNIDSTWAVKRIAVAAMAPPAGTNRVAATATKTAQIALTTPDQNSETTRSREAAGATPKCTSTVAIAKIAAHSAFK